MGNSFCSFNRAPAATNGRQGVHTAPPLENQKNSAEAFSGSWKFTRESGFDSWLEARGVGWAKRQVVPKVFFLTEVIAGVGNSLTIHSTTPHGEEPFNLIVGESVAQGDLVAFGPGSEGVAYASRWDGGSVVITVSGGSQDADWLITRSVAGDTMTVVAVDKKAKVTLVRTYARQEKK